MSIKPMEMDASYLLAKREKLLNLRLELERLANANEAEEAQIRSDASRQAREYEDESEQMDLLERQGRLVNRSVEPVSAANVRKTRKTLDLKSVYLTVNSRHRN